MVAQQIIVLLLFMAAVSYAGWRAYKAVSKTKSGGCAKGCGCAAGKAVKI
ncbi:hypothetical protein DYBT9275_00818 [Dyadobacter sp. CECT 9275]|uniref:FeoB-associated Cys-rich membrane protein n=2 Tax=Dyadobacter helix TaxID=2822344 RepID=A0A916NJX7_9BACT|nr:hypothetical protein DYBT9275_00818 [Dyadobacter sp. CECT 9275]